MGLVATPGLNPACPMGPGIPGPMGGWDMGPPGNPEPNGGGPMWPPPKAEGPWAGPRRSRYLK